MSTNRQDHTITAPLRRRLVGVLFLGQSFFSAAQILTFALLPIVATALSGSEAWAGIPATLTLLGRAAAAFPVGWLMDRLGRRFGLASGFMLCTVGSIASALAIGWHSFPFFLLGVVVAGMGRGIGEQARFAAAEVETSDRRAKAIGLVVFAGTVGAVVGPRLLVPAEQLAGRFGLDVETGPFLLGALLFYLAFMLTVLFLRPDPMHVGRALDAAEPRADAPPQAVRALRAIFADWNVRLALLAMTIGQLVMTTLMVITPLYMSKLDYTVDDIGWVLMAHTLGMFALSSLTGWLIDRTNSVIIIVAGGLILVVSAILTPIAGTLFSLALALFLLGLGWNFCFVAGSALLAAALRPGERGRVQGASETLVSLASGTGSLSVGVLFAQGGMSGISLGGLFFSVALLIATLWIARLRPQPLPLPGD
jgi:MFS family permease